MIKSFFFAILLFLVISARAQNCNNLPKSFSSYEQATRLLKTSKFSFVEKVNTSESSWIRSAIFKSCDGKTGFLIIGTDKHPYIHQGVPVDLWLRFKQASSFGSFYNKNFKNRYKLSD